MTKQFKLKQLHARTHLVYIETLLNEFFPDDNPEVALINELSSNRAKQKEFQPELVEKVRKLLFRNVIWALRKDLPIYEFYDEQCNKLEIKIDIKDEQEFNRLKASFPIESIGIDSSIVDYIRSHYPMVEKANMTILVDFLDGINIVPKLYTKLQIASGEFRKERNISQGDKANLFSYQDNICFYCGKDMGDTPHADHFIPYDYVLESEIWNMVGACQHCNTKKKNYLVNSETIKHLMDRNADKDFQSRFSELKDRDPKEVEQLLDQHYRNCALYFRKMQKNDLIA